jgi:hypothetical protein
MEKSKNINENMGKNEFGKLDSRALKTVSESIPNLMKAIGKL